MRFSIVSRAGVLIGSDLDENAPSIRLIEGRPLAGQKRPIDLGPGEGTRVAYPLAERRDPFECRIVRTDGAQAAVGVDPGIGPDRSVAATVRIDPDGGRTIEKIVDPACASRLTAEQAAVAMRAKQAIDEVRADEKIAERPPVRRRRAP